jgi:hypothetical protein
VREEERVIDVSWDTREECRHTGPFARDSVALKGSAAISHFRDDVVQFDSEAPADMGRTTVLFRTHKHEIALMDEPLYTPGSADNLRSYSREYKLTDAGSRPSSRHALVLRDDDTSAQSVILLAGGGVTGLHEHSALILGDTCFVAVGDTLCSLALPSLELLWHRQVDTATCFGVYYSAKHHCLISHGELEIARLSLSGEVAWSSGGADIFSEGFELHPDYIEAVDFNRMVYRMDIATGASMK